MGLQRPISASPNGFLYITEDLLTEILVILPVKTLLRCKAVSKPWLSLISNPNFVKSHLKHNIRRPGADRTLIIKPNNDRDNVSLLHLDSPHSRVPLGLPYCRGRYSRIPNFSIYGTCNGLVCVSAFNENHDIYLWNPATKQAKLIPPHNIRHKFFLLANGFGFDPVTNDYKVVRVVIYCNAKPKAAEVYSANTNAWRQLQLNPEDNINKFQEYPVKGKFDVCVSGFLCCLAGHGLVAFNLETEVFTCPIPIPGISITEERCLTDYNGSIAVITSQEDEKCDIFSFNLWKLDDEACLRGGGVEASWTLMLNIDVDYPVLSIFCFNSGDFLLQYEFDAWLLYKSHKKEARYSPFLVDFCGKINKYNESLVSITGSKQVDWNAQEDDN